MAQPVITWLTTPKVGTGLGALAGLAYSIPSDNPTGRGSDAFLGGFAQLGGLSRPGRPAHRAGAADPLRQSRGAGERVGTTGGDADDRACVHLEGVEQLLDIVRPSEQGTARQWVRPAVARPIDGDESHPGLGRRPSRVEVVRTPEA